MPAPLTDMQERFAVEFAMNGGNATKAAIAAGYSEKSADDLGRRTFQLEHVQERILRELVNIRARSGAIGLDAMVRVAQSTTAPAAAVVSAARSLMEHAGLLGTAKEVADARAEAAKRGGPVVDYAAVLDALGRLPKPANSDVSLAEMVG